MVRVFLLGRFETLIDQGPASALEGRKTQELLAYLSLAPDRAHNREVLATLLWPDQDEMRARQYLRKALWQLQSSFSQSGSRLLTVEQESVCLSQTADLWIDAHCLQQTFTAVRNVPGDQLTVAQVELLQQVSLLYRGDLLENWYLDWCLVARQHLQHMYLSLIDKLIRHCMAHGYYDSGLQYGHQILAHDLAREHTHRDLMLLLYLAEDRTGAIRQYQYCVHVLERELGVPPSEQTKRLYDQICAGRRLAGPLPPDPDPAPAGQSLTPRPPSNQANQALVLLHEDTLALQAALTRFQNHLQQLLIP